MINSPEDLFGLKEIIPPELYFNTLEYYSEIEEQRLLINEKEYEGWECE